MREIPLTRGYVAIVDDEDYERVARFKWQVKTETADSQTCYAQRNQPRPRRKTEFLHRVVMRVTNPSQHVDHINGNGLDCRKENLRIATISQNARNTRKRGTFTSRFKGVSRFRGIRWQAQIRLQNKNTHLGVYTDEVEAARVYDAAARANYGEFARLNFPGPNERSAHG